MVSMPQSARATFKLPPHSIRGWYCRCFNASIGTSNLQANGITALTGDVVAFQCLNRHEQPSSPRRPGESAPSTGFNASIGTSNLQACPISTSSTSIECFNASIGTSNLQAGRRRATWPLTPSFNASIGTSNLQAGSAFGSGTQTRAVSMPQSARATFKQDCN